VTFLYTFSKHLQEVLNFYFKQYKVICLKKKQYRLYKKTLNTEPTQVNSENLDGNSLKTSQHKLFTIQKSNRPMSIGYYSQRNNPIFVN